MSSNLPIAHGDITAPTPQNTPLNQAPIAQGLSRPTVPDISEDNEQEEDGEGVLPPGAQSAMLGLVQNRLSDLVGKSSGYIESLPTEVKMSIEALKGVQVKQNELQNQYKRECLELEKKVRDPSTPPFFFFNPSLYARSNRSFASSYLISTSNSTSLSMSDEMQSSLAHLRPQRRRSKLAFRLRSRTTQTTRHSPRMLQVALPQSQSFGSRPFVTTLGFQISSPNATRLLSNTSLIFVSLTSPTTNPSPVSRSLSISAQTSSLRMTSWTRRISIRRKWDTLAILSLTVRSVPKSSGRRTRT